MALRARIIAVWEAIDKDSALVALNSAGFAGMMALVLGCAGDSVGYAGAAALLAAGVALGAPNRTRAALALAAMLLVAVPAGWWRARRGNDTRVVPSSLRRAAVGASATVKNPCPAGMAWSPGGTFQMGSETGQSSEKPVHTVTVGGFCLDVTEVTAGAYEGCVGEGKCSAEHVNEYSNTLDAADLVANASCNYKATGKENHPMNCVDWTQSESYCASKGKRLPTEEEWEYAAQGGDDQRTYPWGEGLPTSQACWSGEGNDQGKGKRSSSCEVGKYPDEVSRWGARDMAGNVSEWTDSWHCPYTASGRGGACPPSYRVIRGGGWSIADASYLRGAFRNGRPPTFRYYTIGFRCAKTPG